jgi:hypothetical protein
VVMPPFKFGVPRCVRQRQRQSSDLDLGSDSGSARLSQAQAEAEAEAEGGPSMLVADSGRLLGSGARRGAVELKMKAALCPDNLGSSLVPDHPSTITPERSMRNRSGLIHHHGFMDSWGSWAFTHASPWATVTTSGRSIAVNLPSQGADRARSKEPGARSYEPRR